MHGKEGFHVDLADEIAGPVALMHAGEARADVWKVAPTLPAAPSPLASSPGGA
jgi:hypothetical protein